MTGPVRSVSQAFDILRLLAENSPLSLSDVARSAGLSPSSCLNLLRTLVSEGAIERTGREKHYRLTTPWLDIGGLKVGTRDDVINRWRPLMARFARANDAAVGLWQTISAGRLQLVAHAEGGAEMRIHLVVGQRQPLGGGAAGRALAALHGASEDQLARRFSAVRWQTALSLDEYVTQVREAAAQGFAVDAGYVHAGICSVAAAVPQSHWSFCLSASIFAGSRSPEGVNALGLALAELVRLGPE